MKMAVEKQSNLAHTVSVVKVTTAYHTGTISYVCATLVKGKSCMGGCPIPEETIQIDAGFFTAGVVLQWYGAEMKVVRCAPIVKYMKGWSRGQVIAYIHKRGWKTVKKEEK